MSRLLPSVRTTVDLDEIRGLEVVARYEPWEQIHPPARGADMVTLELVTLAGSNNLLEIEGALTDYALHECQKAAEHEAEQVEQDKLIYAQESVA